MLARHTQGLVVAVSRVQGFFNLNLERCMSTELWVHEISESCGPITTNNYPVQNYKCDWLAGYLQCSKQ